MKQGNGGPLFSDPEAVYGVDKLSGSRLGWVMMRCITSGVGAWSGGVSLLDIFLRGARIDEMVRSCIRVVRRITLAVKPIFTNNVPLRLFKVCEEDRGPTLRANLRDTHLSPGL